MNWTDSQISERGDRRVAGWLACLIFAFVFSAAGQAAAPAGTNNLPAWLTRPLSLADALNTALQQNSTIVKAKHDLEASQGIVIQTRAILIPKIQATGNFTRTDPNAVETITNAFKLPQDSWTTGLKLVQSIFEGGRMISAYRTARLTRQQALLQYRTVVEDTLLLVRIAYYDVLVASQRIKVAEASVNLLSREFEDQQRRFEAGTVPRFNVLRAEVAVANARPELIRARNAYRIGKNNLSNLLGYNLPRDIWEDIPLELTDPLDPGPYQVDLPIAIQQALERRTELGALRKAEDLRHEDVVNARAGYYPSLQAFGGYGWHSKQFTSGGPGDELHGWNFGGQVTWDIFDGMLTRGRVVEARALYERSKAELTDTSRRIELEVRTAYSSFIEAREVLESQQKVQEEAEEALRLANARAETGVGTILEVIDAETSLTQARTTNVQAMHDYAVARARLERAIGQELIQTPAK